MDCEAISCKKCGGKKHVKAGFIKGGQRYLCKDCGCKFVPSRRRGRPGRDRLPVVWRTCTGCPSARWRNFSRSRTRRCMTLGKGLCEKQLHQARAPLGGRRHRTGRDVALYPLKKRQVWIWKASCRDTRELIDWECGGRDNGTFSRLMNG